MGSRRYALLANLNPAGFAPTALACTLVLLIVVIISGPSHHSLLVDLPGYRNATAMPAALRDDALRVVLTRDGSIYLGNTRVAVGDLAGLLRQRLHSGAPNKVFFIVDQRARYGELSVALDAVRHAGVWDVAFLAESPVMHR